MDVQQQTREYQIRKMLLKSTRNCGNNKHKKEAAMCTASFFMLIYGKIAGILI